MLGGNFLARYIVNVDLAPPSTSTANYPGPGSPSPLIGAIHPWFRLLQQEQVKGERHWDASIGRPERSI